MNIMDFGIVLLSAIGAGVVIDNHLTNKTLLEMYKKSDELKTELLLQQNEILRKLLNASKNPQNSV